MNGTATGESLNPELAGLEELWHPVVEKHGRAMFELVMHAGLGGEAAQILVGVLQKQHSSHGLSAIRRLADSFNALSNMLAKERGWTGEQLSACELDIKMAYATKVHVVETPKIILAH